jgi:hypothetical protein
MSHISKTQYIEFLDCRKNSWLKIHKPELLDLFELSDFEKTLLKQGNDVEQWARLLFPTGKFITSAEGDVIELAKSHIIKKTPIIFQPTSVHDVFLARHDILKYDEASGKWNLYEVKSTSSLKENSKEIDHIEDATFQAVILKENGAELNKIFIICLNKEYIRFGDINTSLCPTGGTLSPNNGTVSTCKWDSPAFRCPTSGTVSSSEIARATDDLVTFRSSARWRVPTNV